MGGFILLGAFFSVYVMVIATMSANTAGHTKKAFTAGVIWATFATANGVAPYLVKTTEVGEHYPTEFKTVIGASCGVMVLAAILYTYLAWQNKKRDVDGKATVDGEDVNFHDLTDGENPYFRYSF